MSKKTLETSSALQSIFYQYTHLPIGGKEICCPYWMNRNWLGITGPYGGKGRPQEIVDATEKEAEKANLDLKKATESEILNFMKRKKIGVDCSGFVFWMLDALDREKGGNGIADDMLEATGQFIASRANVKLLTSEEKSFSINKINEVQAGDMIRLDGGKHIAIIIAVLKDEVGNILRIDYAHSSRKTLISGVHSSSINIIDVNSPLFKQEWIEKTASGKNYGELCFRANDGDNIKRLKIWKH